MSAKPEDVLADFISAWSAGGRPDIDEHLARVTPDERRELAQDIAAYVELAPPRALSEADRQAVRAAAPFAAAMQRIQAEQALLGEEVRVLRARRGLTPKALADRLVAALGLPSADTERAADYVDRLEEGELDPSGVSRRLTDALADVLGTARERLAAAAMLGRPPATAGGTLFRMSEGRPVQADDIAVASAAAFEPFAPAPAEADELDRLFTGGPDA